MELFTFTLAAGETKIFHRAGRLLEVIDAPYPLTVRPWGAEGQQLESLVNALSGIYIGQSFGGFDVTSALAQTITLLVTDGAGGSRRQPGVVRIVDSERDKVIANSAFRATMSQAGGGAGLPRCQVFNPAGSGRLVFVNGVIFGGSTAAAYSVETTTTQAPTAGLQSRSLDADGADGVSIGRTGNDATAYAAARSLASGFFQASTDREIVFRRPVLLRAGRGLMVYSGDAAAQVRASFDLEEYVA